MLRLHVIASLQVAEQRQEGSERERVEYKQDKRGKEKNIQQEATIQVNPLGMPLLLQPDSHSACSESDWSSPEITLTVALSMPSEPVSVSNTTEMLRR